VDALGISFVTTPQAKGIVSERHPCSLRTAGMSASMWARRYCAREPDVALVLGTDLDKTLPYFDPGVAQVPGLVVHGAEDELQGPEDALDLAANLGPGGASLVSIPKAGHIPRVEADVRDAFWSEVLAFLA
jgi:pimeloyl-ACP methyl ester carboxylesterase